MDKVHAKYWERLYPRNYHLEILATHPDYRRRGAATSLIKWGVFQALREGVDAGLESSPMAFSLYRKLGFALQEEVVIHVDGDDSRIMTRVMLYDKKK